MKKTVAIVGSHPRTRDLAPWDNRQIDIWVFNDASHTWAKRATADFQMHKRELYRQADERGSNTITWLRDNATMPVYLLEADPEIPSGIAYPLDEICQKYLGSFRRGNDVDRYFTSSVCYAIALAIYQGYKRVEMYGVEMEMDTEYIYQRDGIGLWLGIALGLGLEVSIPKNTALFDAPLYGYDEEISVIGRDQFETRCHELEAKIAQMQRIMNNNEGRVLAYAEMMDAEKDDAKRAALAEKFWSIQNEYQQSILEFGALQGQYVDCKMWLERVDALVKAAGGDGAVAAFSEAKGVANGATA